MLVLSVGQCGFDDLRLEEVVGRELGATLERAGDAQEARRMMGEKRYDLLLVNRMFDGDGDSGVAFIGAMKAAGEKVAMMLVSNYEDAQAEAVAKGAVRGFGKNALGSAEVGEVLRKAAGVGN